MASFKKLVEQILSERREAEYDLEEIQADVESNHPYLYIEKIEVEAEEGTIPEVHLFGRIYGEGWVGAHSQAESGAKQIKTLFPKIPQRFLNSIDMITFRGYYSNRDHPNASDIGIQTNWDTNARELSTSQLETIEMGMKKFIEDIQDELTRKYIR